MEKLHHLRHHSFLTPSTLEFPPLVDNKLINGSDRQTDRQQVGVVVVVVLGSACILEASGLSYERQTRHHAAGCGPRATDSSGSLLDAWA